MKKQWTWIFAAALGFLLAAILIRVAAPQRRVVADQDDEDDEEEAIQAPSRVSIQNGQTTLTFNAATQARAGIAVASLQAVISRKQVTAPAIVLSPLELVTARASYVVAAANSEKLRVSRDVAQQESDRLQTLYQDQQNASQKDVQAAQGVLRSDQASVQAAEQELALQEAAVRQNWGEGIAKWVAGDTPALDRVLAQQDFLVQVTLPAGAASAPPRTVSLSIPGSNDARGELISRFPRVDPRMQSVSFLYLTASHSGLAPGLNLTAHVGVGRARGGVLIPQSAVVWWQGNAWVYQQTAPGRFVRRLVSSDTPLPNGLFASSGFSAGEQIVIRGAQLLLSEEFRSQIQPED
jgi:hypothetical protein